MDTTQVVAEATLEAMVEAVVVEVTLEVMVEAVVVEAVEATAEGVVAGAVVVAEIRK